MLSPEAPYPIPGSYALLSDPDLPYPQPTELVRIMWRRVDSPPVGADGRAAREPRGFVALSFPLHDGASGNKVVPAESLIDGTPLTAEEQREFHDLDRDLLGREPRNLSKRQRARAARRDALKSRMIWSRFMAGKLREMREREQRRAA